MNPLVKVLIVSKKRIQYALKTHGGMTEENVGTRLSGRNFALIRYVFAHLCLVIHSIRCLLNFDKPHRVSR